MKTLCLLMSQEDPELQEAPREVAEAATEDLTIPTEEDSDLTTDLEVATETTETVKRELSKRPRNELLRIQYDACIYPSTDKFENAPLTNK